MCTKNTNQEPLIIPPKPVRKVAIIKCRAFVDGVGSETVSRTFFVWGPEGNPYNMPIISIQTQENYLFDYNIGNYTAGVDFDTWRTKNPEDNKGYRPDFSNYWRKGRETERPVSIELFDSDLRSVMNSNAGWRINGNNSRSYKIKSLRIYARGEYSKPGNFKHNLFDQIVTGSPLPDNQKFKSIKIRGNGEGGYISHDVVANRLMQPVYLGATRIKPCIHFINGEYWGITAIRDRFDKNYYAINFNLDPDNITIVQWLGDNYGINEGDDRDLQQFAALQKLLTDGNMANAAQYKQATDLLDMNTFIDHFIMGIFTEDDSNETCYWRVRAVENGTHGDGRWRVSVNDYDAAFVKKEFGKMETRTIGTNI